MIRNWLVRLLRWLTDTGKPSPPPLQPSTPTPPPLVAALEDYRQALQALGGDPQSLLPVLLARDQVSAVRKQGSTLPVEQTQQLIGLDERLREGAANLPLDDLFTWRRTLQPSQAAWWWFLDQEAEEGDLAWVLLTGTLTLLTATSTAEILKRLWDGAPDIVSILGTLITLTLTASPLVKRGQELARWTLKRISWLRPRFRAEAMAGMAALAFVAVLAVRLLLPSLARVYNNQGFGALQAGDLAEARQRFQRAVALGPDLEVPYYNLATVYQRIGRPDEAEVWYRRAIEQDLNYALAYRGLGHLYNAQGEHEKAEDVLLSGLSYLDASRENGREEIVARYALLSDLGWAYFGQGRYERAQETLEAAVALEGMLKEFEDEEGSQYRLPLPHYYLAQVYERLELPTQAYQQWEDCLRLLGQGWEFNEWRAVTVERIKKLEEALQ